MIHVTTVCVFLYFERYYDVSVGTYNLSKMIDYIDEDDRASMSYAIFLASLSHIKKRCVVSVLIPFSINNLVIYLSHYITKPV